MDVIEWVEGRQVCQVWVEASDRAILHEIALERHSMAHVQCLRTRLVAVHLSDRGKSLVRACGLDAVCS